MENYVGLIEKFENLLEDNGLSIEEVINILESEFMEDEDG